MASKVMAYTVMAYTVMAYTVMAYIAMAYIARRQHFFGTNIIPGADSKSFLKLM